MKLLTSLALALPLSLSLMMVSCGPAGGLYGYQQNPETGEMEGVQFTKYFDDGQWLVKDQVGMSVVVDNEGARGNTIEGKGKVTVYFWNFDTREHRVGKLKVDHKGKGSSTPQSNMLAAKKPWTRTKVPFGEIPVNVYATELKVRVTVEVDGKKVERLMTLKRRTVEDNRRLFGPGGTSPYPWADRL